MQLSKIGTNLIAIADTTGAVVKKGAGKAGSGSKYVFRHIKSVANWAGSSVAAVARVGASVLSALVNFVKTPKNLKITAVGVALLTTTVIIARKFFNKEPKTVEEDSARVDSTSLDLEEEEALHTSATATATSLIADDEEQVDLAQAPIGRSDSKPAEDVFFSAVS